jgi:hypothetical protein
MFQEIPDDADAKLAQRGKLRAPDPPQLLKWCLRIMRGYRDNLGRLLDRGLSSRGFPLIGINRRMFHLELRNSGKE